MAVKPFKYSDGLVTVSSELKKLEASRPYPMCTFDSPLPDTVKMGLTPGFPIPVGDEQFYTALDGITFTSPMVTHEFTSEQFYEMFDNSRGGYMANLTSAFDGGYVVGGHVDSVTETPEALRKRAKALDKAAKVAKKAEADKKAATAERKKDRDIARATYRSIATNAREYACDRIAAANCLREMSNNR